jgi:hypothetical protein
VTTTDSAAGAEIRADTVAAQGLNLLLLVYKDARFDVMGMADTPVLDSFAEVRSAQRLAATPADVHRALFAGMLPGPWPDPPLEDGSLVGDLGRLGYQTIGLGADPCFRDPLLGSSFEVFHRRKSSEKTFAQLIRVLDGRPFMALANLGETAFSRAEGIRGQLEGAARVDAHLPALLSALPASTMVVACSDRGVCFGEGGWWSHRPEHQVCREVFLAEFRLDGRPIP